MYINKEQRWVGWYKGGGGWVGWCKGGGGWGGLVQGKGQRGGLVQGKGRVGWAGAREGDKGGVVVGGKGWVGKVGAATRHHKVRGGVDDGCYKGTQGMGGLGIVSIRTLLFRFEPLLTRLSTDNVWLKT